MKQSAFDCLKIQHSLVQEVIRAGLTIRLTRPSEKGGRQRSNMSTKEPSQVKNLVKTRNSGHTKHNMKAFFP